MELKFTTRALLEMDGIAEIIQQNSPRSALRFLKAVEKTADGLLTFPELGALFETDVPGLQGLRVCLVSGFEKYLVFYRIRSDTIRIDRVVHGSRDLLNVLRDEL